MAGGAVSFSARDAGSGSVQFAVDVNGQTANFSLHCCRTRGKITEASVWRNFLKNVAGLCQGQCGPLSAGKYELAWEFSGRMLIRAVVAINSPSLPLHAECLDQGYTKFYGKVPR